ncbi:MAG: hypothetical protein FGM63_06290 [Candidatus Nanopelagicaceae bacterium]|nr:hypothetical protein [Candidatus Nanopelagicaceae bacterium]
MRIRSLMAALLLLATSDPSIASTPPKAGAVCTKAGATKNFQGKRFTCIKDGKSLKWSKGVVIKVAAPEISPSPSTTPTQAVTPGPTPTPATSIIPNPTPNSTSTPTPNPTSPVDELSGKACNTENQISRIPSGEYWCLKDNNGILRWSRNSTPSKSSGTMFKQKVSDVSYRQPSQPSQDVNQCKIVQINHQQGELKSGFPSPIPSYKSAGTVKWALVPIDFSDVPGESNFMDRARPEMQFASDWADLSSEGKFKIEWQVYEKWVRLPGVSSEYYIPPESNGGFIAPAQQNFWQRAIVEADKYVDFTGVQAVQFILPAGQQVVRYGIKGNNWYDVVKNYTTGEGTKIDLFSVPSTHNDEPNSGRNYWSWWMYHFMGGLGVAKYGGNTATELHTYLIQGSTEGARELGGWLRFLVGWMPESRVYCRQASNLTSLDLTLIPLSDNKTQGIKLAVIPISETKALILESRRETKFSCTTPTERNGVLAYVYDAGLGHMGEYFKAVSPSGRADESYSCYASQSRDLLLHEGDRITYQGITVELLAHGNFDQIRLTRTS